MVKKVRVSAPGKIILSGEHAVVYGYPAILAAIDRRLLVEVKKSSYGLEVVPGEGTPVVNYALKEIKDCLKNKKIGGLKINISSQIPIGCGMGSSAAFAVAITAAVLKFFNCSWDLEEINKIAYEIEKKQHGNPSGGDNTIVTYGGFLLYRKESEYLKVFSPLKTKMFPPLFLINSGKPEETTEEMVSMVKESFLNFPKKIERNFQETEKITREFLKLLLQDKSSDIKELLKENERLLEQLKLVSLSTKKLICKIEKIGGAAKISGAGGLRKNSGIILAYHKEPDVLFNFAKKENLDIFKVKLGEEGVN